MEPIEELLKNIRSRSIALHEGLKFAELKHVAIGFLYFVGTVAENKKFRIGRNDSSGGGVGYTGHVANDQSRLIQFLDLPIWE